MSGVEAQEADSTSFGGASDSLRSTKEKPLLNPGFMVLGELGSFRVLTGSTALGPFGFHVHQSCHPLYQALGALEASWGCLRCN